MTDPQTPDALESPAPSPARFWLRALWVAIQLALVLYAGEQGATFFYQGF